MYINAPFYVIHFYPSSFFIIFCPRMRTTKGIGGFFLTTALSLLSTSVAAAPEINCDNVVTDISEASTIQDMIDNAAYKG